MEAGKKVFTKELFVLWFSLAALICAAISLNASLNMLQGEEKSKTYEEKESA